MSEEIARKEIIRALLLAADQPLSVRQIEEILAVDGPVTKMEVRKALAELTEESGGSAVELKEVASGWRLQLRREYAPWISRLWQDKAQKYSRAFLETLALICYRQPITRGEIEEIRGVSLSAGILKTMLERGWVREVGYRESPGRPALLATTREFLDDFNLRSLEDLPPLTELTDPEKLEQALSGLQPPVADEAAELADEAAADAETAGADIQLAVADDDAVAGSDREEPSADADRSPPPATG